MNSRLGAFTLTEILVVLILASILLAATMMVYTNVSAYQRRLQTRVSKINAFSRLEYYLKNDLNNNKEMEFSGRRISLIPSGIEYNFYGKTIERESPSGEDTFPLSGYLLRKENNWRVIVDLFEQEVTIRLKTKGSYYQQWRSANE